MNTQRGFIKLNSIKGGKIILPVDTIRLICTKSEGTRIRCLTGYEYTVTESIEAVFSMLTTAVRFI